MPISWDHQKDAQLFHIILRLHPIKIDHARVAEEFGEGATPKAIQQHLFKLKKIAESEPSLPPPASNGTNPPQTPKKRKNQTVANGGITKSPQKSPQKHNYSPSKLKMEKFQIKDSDFIKEFLSDSM